MLRCIKQAVGVDSRIGQACIVAASHDEVPLFARPGASDRPNSLMNTHGDEAKAVPPTGDSGKTDANAREATQRISRTSA